MPPPGVKSKLELYIFKLFLDSSLRPVLHSPPTFLYLPYMVAAYDVETQKKRLPSSAGKTKMFFTFKNFFLEKTWKTFTNQDDLKSHFYIFTHKIKIYTFKTHLISLNFKWIHN